MATLTIGCLVWNIKRVAGKPAFTYGSTHAIFYHEDSKHWLLTEKGEAVHLSKNVAECLDTATNIVLDCLARDIKPSWYGCCD